MRNVSDKFVHKVHVLFSVNFFYFGCEHIPHGNNISENARIKLSDFRIQGIFLATRKQT